MNNHLYIMNVDILSDEELFQYYYEKSSEFRKRKIGAFRFKKDKRLSLGAGMLLHNALSREGISDKNIWLDKNKKPFIYGRNDVFFNISHSGTLVVCAVSDCIVGVDIEQEQHFEKCFLNNTYLPGEIEYVLRNYNSQDRGFTELWTFKESIMKYFGIGISLEPKNISISYGDVVRAEVDGFDSSRLRFTQYPLQGYALTVCSEYENFTNEVEWLYSMEQTVMY